MRGSAAAISMLFFVTACAAPAARRADESKTLERPPTTATDPKYRTVDRAASAQPAPPEVPFNPFDPFVDTAVPVADRETVAGEFSVALDETAAAFVGNFTTRSGDELALVTPTGEFVVVAPGGDVRARRGLGIIDRDHPPRTARLVDNRLDLVVVWREDEAAAPTLSVFRVIGSAIAEVFRAPLDNARVEYGRRGEENAIIVFHADGHDVYRWNRWEGMFRIPRPAPTAPVSR